MYQKSMLRPLKLRKNCNNKFEVLLTLISLGISVYILSINKRNLYYNIRSAIASENIAKELKTVNESHFMENLNGKIFEEKE